MSSETKYSKRVMRYLRPHRKQFILAMLCMVVFGATDGGVPFIVKYALDGVFSKHNTEMLYMLPVIIIGFALLRAIGDFGQQYFMGMVGHRVVRDMRSEVQKHLLKMSPDFYIKRSAGEILSRITGNTLLVRSLVTDTAAAVIRDSISVIVLLCSCIYLDPFLAMVAALLFPIAGFPIAKLGKRMRKLSKRGQDSVGALSAILQETMLGNRIVSIFGRQDLECAKFDRENEALTKTLVRSEMIRGIAGPINEILASIAISGVLTYGGYSVIAGTRTQGDFIAFLLSVFLLYEPFKKLSKINSTVQQGLASAQRVFEVIDTPPLITEPANPIALGSGNEIELRGVHFTYRVGDNVHPAISNIDLTIKEGEKVALVGFSGAGKSTLVDLIPRFIDPTEGVVLIGEIDISKVRLADLRNRIAMVNQHTFLFHDTIFNNIAYGKENATKEEVIEAARTAFAYDFIMRLPNQFDSIVGEGGMMLSGGERQRIAIARAVLKNAPILILDEATASLDNRSEREVQLALERLEKGRTTIVIAHRLSTVRSADRIVVMHGGKIVEIGGHDQLLRAGGEYSRLHAFQGEAAIS